MSIDTLRAALPAYAKDLSLNLSSLMNETVMSDQQKWGTFIACAYAVGVGTVIRELEDGCPLSAEIADAAKAAAAIMGMNNVYYRALHLMKSREYATMPARLRMNVIANPGAPKADFELWCTAVSAINGCGLCLDSHEEVLRTHGTPAAVIQAALRIGAVVNAVARVIAAEEGRRAGAAA
jgi:alkyl hydroperoxide reductase subunit D